jgi:hypothetical protein
MHASTQSTSSLPPRDAFDLSYGVSLDQGLAKLRALPADARTAQVIAREMLEAHLPSLQRSLQECLVLQVAMRRRAHELVLCHTDLNGGNVLTGGDGCIYIVDWEDMRLAPMERDFRYLTELGRGELVLAAYGELRPVRPDPEVLAFCYYREALSDTAYLACGISQRDATDEEDARDLGFLENMCDWAGTDRLRDWAADLRRVL